MQRRVSVGSTIQLLAGVTIGVILSGCLFLNDVDPISQISPYSRAWFAKDKLKPRASRAVVVFGVGLEEQYPYAVFPIQIDEYDIERQSITGNCWRYNKMDAAVPAIVGTHQCFAFDVEPGFYVFPGYLGDTEVPNKSVAFEVPAGQIVFFGDFIRSKGGKIELNRDPNFVRAYFNEEVLLAETRMVAPARGVLCTP